MTGARAGAGVLALATAFGAVRPQTARAAEPDTPVLRFAAGAPDSYPLVFLFQGDAVVDSTPGAGAAAGNDPTGGSHVRVRRLRVGDDVASGDWRARVVLEASSPEEPVAPAEGGRIPFTHALRVIEAFGAWRPHRGFEVVAGAQRVPFSLSRQVDALDLRLPERAQVVVALAPDYRTGVAVASDLGLLNLRVSGMSAARSFDGELLTSGFFGAVRLGADPIGPMGTEPWRRRSDDPWYGWWRFSAGVSVLYGTLLEPRTLGLGGDAQLQWRRLTVTGEYLGQHVSGLAASWPWQGAVVEPGVFIIKERLELVLRGAWYHQPATTPLAPSPTNTLASGGALTFFMRDGHLRLQAGLELRHTLDDRLPDSGWAIIRLSAAL